MTLDVALEKDLVELLAGSFKAAQIEELGCLVLGSFDIYRLLNEQNHVTIPARRAAQLLVERCVKSGRCSELIHLLVETDGTQFMGRRVKVEGIEPLLEKLPRSGLVYSYEKGRVIKRKDDPLELANWGSLRSGRSYDVTVMSVDVVGSSALARRVGAKRTTRVLFQFTRYLKSRLRDYNGRVWNWNGDGGIVAFTFKGHESRAVRFALDLQLGMPVFNSELDLPQDYDLALRVALDSGKVAFHSDTGAIVSDVINFACHLEKSLVLPGSVGISGELRDRLPLRLAAPFATAVSFQEREAALLAQRIDRIGAGSEGTDRQIGEDVAAG